MLSDLIINRYTQRIHLPIYNWYKPIWRQVQCGYRKGCKGPWANIERDNKSEPIGAKKSDITLVKTVT